MTAETDTNLANDTDSTGNGGSTGASTVDLALFVVAQISLLLFKKLLNDWRETREQLHDLRASKPDAVSEVDDSPP